MCVRPAGPPASRVIFAGHYYGAAFLPTPRRRISVFEHWMTAAQTIAPHLGVPAQVAMRAHAVVCSTMGSEWVDEQARRTDQPVRTTADVHPLYFALSSQTEFAIVEVCELAALLLNFRADDALGEMIASLRSPAKYHATVLELDMAWKFQGAGATVTLAPPTTHGVADCAVTINGRHHIVEVSGFPSDPFQSDLMAFNSAMLHALKSAIRKSDIRGHIAVEIVVSSDVATSHRNLRMLRKDAHAGVVSSVRAFANGGGEYRTQDAVDFGTIGVRCALPRETPNIPAWTMASCLTTVDRSQFHFLGDLDYKQGRDSHWVYLSVPEEAFDPYDRIRRKLKIEARQLRECTDGVIVVVVNGLHKGVFEEADEDLNLVVADFARNHQSTTAIALPIRPRKRDGTSGLSGPYFALTESALPRAVWDHMVAVDRQRSVLSTLDALA